MAVSLVLCLALAPETVSISSANFAKKAVDKSGDGVLVQARAPQSKPEADTQNPRAMFKGLVHLVGLSQPEAQEPSPKAKTAVPSATAKDLNRRVQDHIKRGHPVAALRMFRVAPARLRLSREEHDAIQSRIAAAFLYDGRIKSAGMLALQSADRSGGDVALAGWVAGLSLWQQGEYASAAGYFKKSATADDAGPWARAAASFWAFLAYDRAGENRAAMVALQEAAEIPRSFYGLMALQTLGKDFRFNWDVPRLTAQREAVLRATDEGAQALDLLAQDRRGAAETALLRLAGTRDEDMRAALLAVAAEKEMPKLAMRLGHSMLQREGEYLDAALYPLSPWEPQDGFTIDPALVHAVMRQESKFDTSARSERGAMGLMQIMPKTARYVVRGGMPDLKSPKENLKIGQDYLAYLLRDKHVNGDLLRLLVAYNAGPGNLAKWARTIEASDDPLLFIEMIPVNETREYVEKVMASYWMYRLRDGRDVPTLRAISRGEPARYAMAAEDGAVRLAMAGQ